MPFPYGIYSIYRINFNRQFSVNLGDVNRNYLVLRIRQFFERNDKSPAGAAILAGSEFGLDQTRMAELLGFGGVAYNTLDAVWGRDWHLEANAILSTLCETISQLCEDLFIFSMSEFGMVEFDDSLCGTSSIMPQKKNCHAVQYLKGLVGITTRYFVENAYIFKSGTGSPVMEGQRIMDDLWRVYDEMTAAMPLLGEMIETLTVNTDVMRARAGAYWATAADLAGSMVLGHNLPWRSAHQIVGATVRISIAKGVKPGELTAEIVNQAAAEVGETSPGMTTEEIRKALDPMSAIMKHDMIGAPAPVRVLEELADHRARLKADREWTQTQKRRHRQAAAMLENAIDKILAGQPGQRDAEIGCVRGGAKDD